MAKSCNMNPAAYFMAYGVYVYALYIQASMILC